MSLIKDPQKEGLIDEIIDSLNFLDVDGETMQYILAKVNMEEQMLSQLIKTSEETTIERCLNEFKFS